MGKTFNDPKNIASRVYSALKNSKWEYRTAAGIAEEVHQPTRDVEVILKNSPKEVLVSVIRKSDGTLLYASKDKVSTVSDYWSAARAISAEKFK